jgi:hypothetical protein
VYVRRKRRFHPYLWGRVQVGVACGLFLILTFPQQGEGRY